MNCSAGMASVRSRIWRARSSDWRISRFSSSVKRHDAQRENLVDLSAVEQVAGALGSNLRIVVENDGRSQQRVALAWRRPPAPATRRRFDTARRVPATRRAVRAARRTRRSSTPRTTWVETSDCISASSRLASGALQTGWCFAQQLLTLNRPRDQRFVPHLQCTHELPPADARRSTRPPLSCSVSTCVCSGKLERVSALRPTISVLKRPRGQADIALHSFLPAVGRSCRIGRQVNRVERNLQLQKAQLHFEDRRAGCPDTRHSVRMLQARSPSCARYRPAGYSTPKFQRWWFFTDDGR